MDDPEERYERETPRNCMSVPPRGAASHNRARGLNFTRENIRLGKDKEEGIERNN